MKKGYKLEFTAGSNTHQMEHGIEGDILAVLTDLSLNIIVRTVWFRNFTN